MYPSSSNPHNNTSKLVRQDGMEALFQDAFHMYHAHGNLYFNNVELNVEVSDAKEPHQGAIDEQPSEEASQFYKLLEDMNEKLYKGSKHYRLYFRVLFFHKKMHAWDKGHNYLIEFFKEVFLDSTILGSLKVINELQVVISPRKSLKI